MSFKPYTRHAPAEVAEAVQGLVSSNLARKIGLPVLFFSADDKLLLTGSLDRGRLNLANTTYSVRNPSRPVDLQQRVQHLGDYVFKDAGVIPPVSFTGLLRQKMDERVAVVPLIVGLNVPSTSPQLIASPKWEQNATGNQDRVWADRTEVEQVLIGGLLSDNASTIVRFATQTKII